MAKRVSDDRKIVDVKMDPIAPLVNGLTHQFIQIPASNLTFNDTIRLTFTGKSGVEQHVLLHNFTIANSHPVATVHPVVKYQGLSTTRMSVLNLTRFGGSQSVFSFQDKENTTGFRNSEGDRKYQNFSFDWNYTDGNYSHFDNASYASHAWRALGDKTVRVTVSDGLDLTTADILVHIKNFTPQLTYLDARVVPAANSNTSTNASETVNVTNVVRVTVHWRDDDSYHGADRVYLDFYNVTYTAGAPLVVTLNATWEVSQSVNLAPTISVFELPLGNFTGNQLRVCIRDVINNLTLPDGSLMPGLAAVGLPQPDLTPPAKICLTKGIVQSFLPVDLRDIRILHVVSGEAPVSTVGNVSDVFVNAPVDLSTPEARNRTEEAFLNATRLAISTHPRVFAVEGLGYPQTERVEAELGRLRDFGTLIIAPVESRSIGVTQYFTADGIGASRWAIGVGVANQSMDGSRLGTPAGPDALMSPKPDFLVALPDAWPSPEVQAVRNVTDILSLLMLKGIIDPFILEEYLKTLAVPAWNGVDSTENAWRQGYGILNTTRILGLVPWNGWSPNNASADPSNETWSSSSKINHMIDLMPVALNPSLDFGVTDKNRSVPANLTIANPSMILPSLVDQLIGSPKDRLIESGLSTSVAASPKTVRINTTFYYWPETLLNNLSEAVRSHGHESAVLSLMGSESTDAGLDLPPPSDTLAALNASRGTLANALKPYYFVQEATVTVGGNFTVNRTLASVDPLLDLASIAYNRTNEILWGAPNSLTTQQRNDIFWNGGNIQKIRVNLAKAATNGAVRADLSGLNASFASILAIVPGDPIFKPLNDTLRNYTEQVDRLMNASVGSVLPAGGESVVTFNTLASETGNAPFGFYFGVTRIIADDVCNNSTATGQKETCRRIIDTLPSGIYLTRDVNVTVRYRDGVPIPNATVELLLLDTAPDDPGICEGTIPSPKLYIEVQLAMAMLKIQTVWRNVTGADGNTTMPAVLPGYWCTQFPYPFPTSYRSHNQTLAGAPLATTESFPIAELSPHQWGLQGLPTRDNFTKYLLLWGYGSVFGHPGAPPTHLPAPIVPLVRHFSDGIATGDAEGITEESQELSEEEKEWSRDQLCSWTKAYNELFGVGFDPDELEAHLGSCASATGPFEWSDKLLMHEAFFRTGRVQDNVTGTDWNTSSLPPPPNDVPGTLINTSWTYQADSTSITATSHALTNLTTIGVISYPFTIPENEYVAMWTSYEWDYVGVRGFYIVALGSEAEASAANVVVALVEGVVSANVLAKPTSLFTDPNVRIVPFTSGPSLTVNLGAPDGDETVLKINNNGTHGNMTTFSEWNTRASNPRGGSIFFVFWRENLLDVSLLRISAYDYRVYTALGTRAPVDLDEYAYSFGNALDNTRVNPLAEGWDVFVPTSTRLESITVWNRTASQPLDASRLVDVGPVSAPAYQAMMNGTRFDDHPVMFPKAGTVGGHAIASGSGSTGGEGGGIIGRADGSWRYDGRVANPSSPAYLEQEWQAAGAGGVGEIPSSLDSSHDPLGEPISPLLCPGCAEDLLDRLVSSARNYTAVAPHEKLASIVHDGIWLNTSFNQNASNQDWLTWNETYTSVGWAPTMSLPLDPASHFLDHGVTGNYTLNVTGLPFGACAKGLINLGDCGLNRKTLEVYFDASLTVSVLGGVVGRSFDFGEYRLVFEDASTYPPDDSNPDRVRICGSSGCDEYTVDECPSDNDLAPGTLACHLNMEPPGAWTWYEMGSATSPNGRWTVTWPDYVYVWGPLYVSAPSEAAYKVIHNPKVRLAIEGALAVCWIDPPPGGCPVE